MVDQISAEAGRPQLIASSKSKSTALILSWMLGWLGADRFYLGDVGLGILKLLTFGGCGLWSLIDAILLTVGSWDRDSNGHYLIDRDTVRLVRSANLRDQFGNAI